MALIPIPVTLSGLLLWLWYYTQGRVQLKVKKNKIIHLQLMTMHILHSELIRCKGIGYIAYFVFRKLIFAVVSRVLVSYAYHSLSDSGEPRKHINISIYITEYRTPLSPRRTLIGSSRDFARGHGSSEAWKWSRSDVDCSLLIKVTGENSVNALNLFIVLCDLYTERSVVTSAANVIGCG